MHKLKLYNTATKSLEPFQTITKNLAKIYTCGPTVYDRAHLGNLASYVYWDLLVRTLCANDYQVQRIINLTDVGHLSSDADEGEDKLEKKAKTTKQTVWEIADHYIDLFLKDFNALNLIQPQKFARATDYIKESIELVDILAQKGYTYKINDGIYFDTSKFKRYADFANLQLDQQETAKRIIKNEAKKHPADFALWKFILPGDTHAMRWDYLNRPGYPGWHLECSTIIHTNLKEPIDIHTGGVDHIPIHHTNEIAQSECAFEQTLSHYWLHCNFLTIEDQKISKSLGNTLNLDDLASQNFSPLDFKLWVLQGHYRSLRNFKIDNLTSAKNRLKNWQNKVLELLQIKYQALEITPNFTKFSSPAPTKDSLSTLQLELLSAVNDDLNSAKACQIIDNSNLNLSDWQFVDNLFGLHLFNFQPLTKTQLSLLQARQSARDNKDYQLSDKIREQLHQTGIHPLDTSSGQIWQIS